MGKIVSMLSTQTGRLSLARMTAVGMFFMWVLMFLWTLFLNRSYGHFDTVSAVFCLMYFVVICGKVVDSKIVTIKGDDKK